MNSKKTYTTFPVSDMINFWICLNIILRKLQGKFKDLNSKFLWKFRKNSWKFYYEKFWEYYVTISSTLQNCFKANIKKILRESLEKFKENIKKLFQKKLKKILFE